MSITAPEWLTPSGILAQLKANMPVSFNLQANGLVRYFLDGGRLPQGVALAENGAVYGSAAEHGEFEFIVAACNGVSRTSRVFSLVVQP